MQGDAGHPGVQYQHQVWWRVLDSGTAHHKEHNMAVVSLTHVILSCSNMAAIWDTQPALSWYNMAAVRDTQLTFNETAIVSPTHETIMQMAADWVFDPTVG